MLLSTRTDRGGKWAMDLAHTGTDGTEVEPAEWALAYGRADGVFHRAAYSLSTDQAILRRSGCGLAAAASMARDGAASHMTVDSQKRRRPDIASTPPFLELQG